MGPSSGDLLLSPTRLVGRDAEIAAGLDELRRTDLRLLTLTGPAGTGKTRLALALATRLAPDFPDGVVFVDLAPVSDPVAVVATIARALGLKEVAGVPIAETVRGALGARRLLLLLDNFEQVLTSGPGVADLLGRCPALKLLITSRAPLRLRWEHERPVPPLTLPEEGAALDQVAASPAVVLFVERARAVAPGFALTAENASDVAEVCRRLDGLPLAIELAAARVKVLVPRDLVALMARRPGLLAGGPRDQPARHRTLRVALDWSHDLLGASERRLFRRLAVFVGGWTLGAAEAVASEDPGIDALEGLAALVDASMVRRGDAEGEETRFAMLETMRTYAAERLAASGDRAAARRAHARYYLSLAEATEGHLYGADAPARLAMLAREHDNLRAALRWALEAGEAAMGLRPATALSGFWRQRGHVREGRTWLTELLARLPVELPGDHGGRSLRARALSAAGVLARDAGDLAAARQLFSEAVALLEALGEDGRLASTQQHLGQVLLRQGEYPAARAHLEASLAGLRRLGDGAASAGIFACLVALALLALQQRRLAAAMAYVAEAEASAREAGSPHVVAQALTLRGILHVELGEHGAAESAVRAALERASGAGATIAVLDALHALASAAAARGDAHRAAVLAAAHAAARDRTGIDRVMEHAALQGRLRAALSRLEPGARAAAAAEGAAMTLEQGGRPCVGRRGRARASARGRTPDRTGLAAHPAPAGGRPPRRRGLRQPRDRGPARDRRDDRGEARRQHHGQTGHARPGTGRRLGGHAHTGRSRSARPRGRARRSAASRWPRRRLAADDPRLERPDSRRRKHADAGSISDRKEAP